MEKQTDLARIEAESSLMFGLKWSCVGFAIALCFLAGCSRLFDYGPARYNTVEGPLRPPPMNLYSNNKQAAAVKQQVSQNGFVQQAQPQQMLYPGMAGVQPPAAMGQMQQPAQPPMMQQPQMQQPVAMPAPQMPMQPAMAPRPMPQTFARSQSQQQESGWFDGWFDWFSDDDSHPMSSQMTEQPVVQRPVGYPPIVDTKKAQMASKPYGYPVPADSMPVARPMGSVKSQARSDAATPDFMVTPPTPHTPSVPMPQLPVTPQAPLMPQPQAMAQPMPQQVPVATAGGSPNRTAIQAQIAELERELAASESRSNALRAEQEKQAKEDGSWLPNLGISDMLGDEQPQAKAVMPGMVPANPNNGYKVVRLPPPPRNGGMLPPLPNSAPQPVTGVVPQQQQPLAPQAMAAPMPPVINAPAYDPMANAPVMTENQPSIDVPLAPDVGSARRVPSNIPQGLLPPDSDTARAGGAKGYLGENRYSNHSMYQGFSH